MKVFLKIIKGLFKFIGVVLGLVVLLVGLLAGSLYVKDTTEVETSSFDATEFATTMLSRSLDNAVEDRGLVVSVEQSALNGLLNDLINKNETVGKYANSYILMDENGYELVIRGHYEQTVLGKVQLAYYTRAKLKMKLQTIKGANPIDDYFVFKITDLEVGNIDGLLNVAKWGLNTFNSFGGNFDIASIVQSYLDSANISATFSYEDLSITYKMIDFIDDIKALVTSGADSDTMSLYMSFLEEFINFDMISFDFQRADHRATIEVSLDMAAKGINPYKDLHLTPIINTDIKERIQTLYTAGACQYSDISNLYTYFFNGYEYISSDETIKSLVDNMDMSSLEDFDKTTWSGIVTRDATDPTEIILSQIEGYSIFDLGKILSGKTLAYLKETELDSYVQSMDGVLGFNFLLPREEDGKLYINDIVVDNIYTDIQDNQLDLFVGLSFNGLDTCINISTELVETDNPYVVQFNITSIKLGHLDVTDGLGSSLLKIVKSAMGSEGLIKIVLPESSSGDDGDSNAATTEHGCFQMNLESAVSDDMKEILDDNHRAIAIRLTSQESGNGRLELYTKSTLLSA